ncbi:MULTISPECIES: hypothetical protein [unclassified Clostridioides]|uniref:hypothetical protein n=1 Tax=unclassified Clostridioides TaxID=2635829 RepID=UPI001D0FBDF5|nr:hypothetical protein [Clostridioides sp. ES-S-0005-03]MCC0707259.1 hypothetical protein [Clostridioides sp. ES-S-0190-01]
MDEKILELLQEMQGSITEMKKDIDTRFSSIENRLDTMQDDITEIKSDVKINRNTLDAVIKHTSKLVEDTTDIKKDLNKVEIVTSSNWTDIAKLKSVR